MRVCIHRGTRQIGGSCVEIEHDGNHIVLDFGLPLDGQLTEAALVPRITKGLSAVVISHPHIDHYGLLHHLPPGTPVCMGAAARRIISAAAPFTGQPLPALDGPELEHLKPLAIGPFRITPYLVDHSAYDAYALLVEAGGKRLFYSGDFRSHGRKGKLFNSLINHPPENVDALLMEGSSLSRLEAQDDFPSESDLENEFAAIFRATPGLVMVHASAQNIDRVVTLYRACKQSGRTMVIDLYAAAVLEATGNEHIPQSCWPHVALFTPQRQRRQIVKNQAFDVLKRHSVHRIFREDLRKMASRAVLLFRPLHMQDLEAAGCLEGASFIYSQWLGYLEQDSYRSMQSWLKQLNIEMEYTHTSGHASPPDLQRFATAVAPKQLVPIHSFAPEKYPQQFANVVIRQDGEWWDL